MFHKENKLSSKEVSILLVYLYVILSLVFIGITLYTSVKLNYGAYRFNEGINQGYARAVTEAINTATECKPFSLYSGDTRVNLVNLDCVEQAANSGQQVAPPEAGENNIDQGAPGFNQDIPLSSETE